MFRTLSSFANKKFSPTFLVVQFCGAIICATIERDIPMHPSILLAFFEFSRTVMSMSGAALVLFLIALIAAKTDIAQAHGFDKFVVLSNLCFALPLAVFGAEHLSAAQGISQIVPSFVPWHLFWAYFVGFALIAASLSIATKIQVQWSGLLFGIMMFLFVAMMDIPGVLHDPKNRFSWALMLRELAFGGGGWLLAAGALRLEGRAGAASKLATVGRVVDRDRLHILWRGDFSAPARNAGNPTRKIDV